MNLSKRIISALTCGAALAATLTGSLSTAVAAGETAAETASSGSPIELNYAKALQYSIYFYDANMCGTEVGENTRFSWRDDCHTYDAHVPMHPMFEVTGQNEDGSDAKTMREDGGTNLSQEFMDKYKDVLDPDGDGTIDVAGGMHDAGDHVSFGMPENYAAATLGWGYYEYRDTYKKLGQDDHIETILRYFNDYLMKCTFRDADGTVIAHCYQVGEGHIDHAVWEAPEVDTMVRPAYFLTAEKPQIDYVVSACASLAINYLNFKDTDPEYAEKSLDYAQALWTFAQDAIKNFPAEEKDPNGPDPLLSDNGDGPSEFYSSTKWQDDYCWAAAWLYRCTEDASVFDYAYSIFDYYAASGWVYCWNDVWSGASLLWAIINEQHPELDMVNKIRKAQGKNEYVFDNFWDSDCIGKILPTFKQKVTAQDMVFIDVWGSCRYSSAFALICLLYDKYHNNGKPSEWSEFAKHQIDYILGDNDITYKENEKQTVLAGRNGTHGPRCFLCGYDETYSVMNPHHRAASGLTMAEDPRQQKHILWGALAGGPDAKDAHSDSTNDWRENEVTIDYNAAFVGACAGMYEFYGTDDMKVVENFPPEDPNGSGDEEGSGYWVEAIGLDNRNDDGTGAVEVSLKVYSGFAKPSKDITVRYYIDASEVKDPSIIETKMLYDQASVEIKGASSEISPLTKWNKMDNVYYVEMKWNDCSFANSGKKYQFSVGFYGKGYTENNQYIVYDWDPTNDWSFQKLKLGEKTDFFAVEDPPEVLCENICIYDNGVLVGGIEPDGTVPATEPPSGDVTDDSEIIWGDANCDGQVNMADAVLIMQSIGNPDKYGRGAKEGITEKGEKNGDVNNTGDGITNKDALAIQKYKLGLLDKLHA